MSRRPARFTQTDLSRAIKAIAQAGSNMMVEVLPDGTMRISPAVSVTHHPAESQAPERVIEL
jgi:hypothetical protein